MVLRVLGARLVLGYPGYLGDRQGRLVRRDQLVLEILQIREDLADREDLQQDQLDLLDQ